MKILANENLHFGIVQRLRESQLEVIYVPEVGLAGRSDKKILEYATKNDLVLISGDKDFGGLLEFGGLWGKGKVILLRYRLIWIDLIVKDIVKVLQDEAAWLAGKGAIVLVLSEAGYRIHKPNG